MGVGYALQGEVTEEALRGMADRLHRTLPPDRYPINFYLAGGKRITRQQSCLGQAAWTSVDVMRLLETRLKKSGRVRWESALLTVTGAEHSIAPRADLTPTEVGTMISACVRQNGPAPSLADLLALVPDAVTRDAEDRLSIDLAKWFAAARARSADRIGYRAQNLLLRELWELVKPSPLLESRWYRYSAGSVLVLGVMAESKPDLDALIGQQRRARKLLGADTQLYYAPVM